MKKPYIGIVFHRKIRQNYEKALYDHGGIPLYLGVGCEPKEVLPLLDGLVLAGGGDPLPQLYGDAFTGESSLPDVARDRFEISLVRKAVAEKIPVLGICRGMQVLNIALGGTLIQDVGRGHQQKENPLTPTHAIRLEENSRLRTLLQCETLAVNSFHHQSVKALGKGLRVAATAADGIIEAIEGNHILGVQWHIEWLNRREEEQKIFMDFVGRAYDHSQKTGINKIT